MLGKKRKGGKKRSTWHFPPATALARHQCAHEKRCRTHSLRRSQPTHLTRGSLFWDSCAAGCRHNPRAEHSSSRGMSGSQRGAGRLKCRARTCSTHWLRHCFAALTQESVAHFAYESEVCQNTWHRRLRCYPSFLPFLARRVWCFSSACVYILLCFQRGGAQ